MRAIVRVCVGLLLLAVLVGCRSKGRSGVVAGKVTYNGQPVNDAALLLYPAGGDQTNPVPVDVDGEGKFRITDVPPGEYKVVVRGAEGGQTSDANLLKMLPPDKREEMKAKMGGGEARKPTIPFPKKYQDLRTSDLRCTITHKDQTLDLELKD